MGLYDPTTLLHYAYNSIFSTGDFWPSLWDNDIITMLLRDLYQPSVSTVNQCLGKALVHDGSIKPCCHATHPSHVFDGLM